MSLESEMTPEAIRPELKSFLLSLSLNLDVTRGSPLTQLAIVVTSRKGWWDRIRSKLGLPAGGPVTANELDSRVVFVQGCFSE